MRVILFLSALLFCNFGFSQTIDDALRYSLYNHTSTARSAGVASVFSSLGADLSAANINPAGIAEFRKSEFVISIGVPMVDVSSRLAGNRRSESMTKVALDNLAAVFFYNPPSFNIKSFNLAIGVNKVADFNETIVYDGVSGGTIVERFLEQATGLTPDELDNFEAGPAFDVGAIYNFDGGTDYLTDFVTFEEQIFRSQTIERSGSIQELFFALASNVNNKFSLGFTLGMPIISVTENKDYLERDDLGTVDVFNELTYSESLASTGIGINLKLGFIYKITPLFRIGGAFHSPSWYFVADEFATSASYDLTNNAGNIEVYEADSPLNELDYRFRSPWRAFIGLGHLYDLGDLKGFVSAEVEYLDYSSGSFNLTADSNDPFSQFIEEDLNDFISSEHTTALNIHLGTELAYKFFRLRAGGALNQSPYSESANYDFDPQYHFGLGFRGNKQYFDVAYTIRSVSRNYSPYLILDPSRQPVVQSKQETGRLTFTLGFKF